MTGSELYDQTKAMLRDHPSPAVAWVHAKFLIWVHLMEEVPQPKVRRFKRSAV